MNDKDKEAFEKWNEEYPEEYLNDLGLHLLMKEAWLAACAHKQGEIDELKLEYDKLIDWASEYKAENAKLKECLEWYGNPENWIIRKGDAWNKSNPKEHGDDEMIRHYKHPEKEWEGTVTVGGKRARQVLRELDEE